MPQSQTPRDHLAEVIRESLAEAGYTPSLASRETGIPLTTLHRHLLNGDFRVAELDALAALIGTRASLLKARAERMEIAA